MKTPDSVIASLETGELLPDEVFRSIDLDAVLDRRDSPAFEERWLHAYKEIESTWGRRTELHAHESSLYRLREFAFRRTFTATSGHHDVAASVSDDFDLICKKNLAEIDQPFVDELEAAYRANRFPG